MRSEYLKKSIRFCCTVNEAVSAHSLTGQAETAIHAGATMIRYTGEASSAEMWSELRLLCRLCRSNQIPFVIRDHLYLAKALGAHGVHLDRSADHSQAVREILGPEAIIGRTVCSPPPDAVDISYLDYIEFSSVKSLRGSPPIRPVG